MCPDYPWWIDVTWAAFCFAGIVVLAYFTVLIVEALRRYLLKLADGRRNDGSR
jgi:hypothetical protein